MNQACVAVLARPSFNAYDPDLQQCNMTFTRKIPNRMLKRARNINLSEFSEISVAQTREKGL
jgi:hypothetical protein